MDMHGLSACMLIVVLEIHMGCHWQDGLKNPKKKQLAGLSVKFYEIILSVFDNSNILRFKGLDELYYIWVLR